MDLVKGWNEWAFKLKRPGRPFVRHDYFRYLDGTIWCIILYLFYYLVYYYLCSARKQASKWLGDNHHHSTHSINQHGGGFCAGREMDPRGACSPYKWQASTPPFMELQDDSWPQKGRERERELVAFICFLKRNIVWQIASIKSIHEWRKEGMMWRSTMHSK